jgi:hypothetical protein
MSSAQRRFGPFNIGVYGLLASIINGINLLFVQSFFIMSSYSVVMYSGPLVFLFVLLMIFSLVLPLYLLDVLFSYFVFVLASSLLVFVYFLLSYSSFSKYSIIGSFRIITQFLAFGLVFDVILTLFLYLYHHAALSLSSLYSLSISSSYSSLTSKTLIPSSFLPCPLLCSNFNSSTLISLALPPSSFLTAPLIPSPYAYFLSLQLFFFHHLYSDALIPSSSAARLYLCRSLTLRSISYQFNSTRQHFSLHNFSLHIPTSISASLSSPYSELYVIFLQPSSISTALPTSISATCPLSLTPVFLLSSLFAALSSSFLSLTPIFPSSLTPFQHHLLLSSSSIHHQLSYSFHFAQYAAIHHQNASLHSANRYHLLQPAAYLQPPVSNSSISAYHSAATSFNLIDIPSLQPFSTLFYALCSIYFLILAGLFPLYIFFSKLFYVLLLSSSSPFLTFLLSFTMFFLYSYTFLNIILHLI